MLGVGLRDFRLSDQVLESESTMTERFKDDVGAYGGLRHGYGGKKGEKEGY